MSPHIYNRSISPEPRSDDPFPLKGSPIHISDVNIATELTGRHITVVKVLWCDCAKAQSVTGVSERLCSTSIFNGSMNGSAARCKTRSVDPPSIYLSVYLSLRALTPTEYLWCAAGNSHTILYFTVTWLKFYSRRREKSFFFFSAQASCQRSQVIPLGPDASFLL